MIERRRLHWHAPERGTAPAFVLSLLAHSLLFLAIAFVVRWKTEPVGTVSAELWTGFPAAPAPVPAPQPVPVPAPVVEPAPPPPPPKVEPRPAPEPERKADIVIEQKKKLEAEKREAERREAEKLEAQKRAAEKREAEKREAEKREAEKRAAEKREAEKRAAEKREAQKREAEAAKLREQALQRMTAAAGGPAGFPQLLSPEQVGQILGVSETEVVGLIDLGELKAKKIGSTYRIKRSAVDAFLDD